MVEVQVAARLSRVVGPLGRAGHLLPTPLEQPVVDRDGQHRVCGQQLAHDQVGQGEAQDVGVPGGMEEKACARSWDQVRVDPAPVGIPVTVPRRVCAVSPVTRAAKRRVSRTR
ncbi:hypothetical protein ADK64_17825 [Streptomyces sp. MMG1121]|nr:hypothetical protein ADK64_17825 [Streptomyces sp. MMG1121]